MWGAAMARRIRLACEDCDYSAEMVERIPFALDDQGEAQPLPPGSAAAPDGYLADWLCGECRRPVRLRAEAGATTPHCPTCGSELLSFEVASRELAAASHSRVIRDLAVEREGARRLALGVELLAAQEEALTNGDVTTQGALDQLASALTPKPDEPLASDLASTAALDGLPPLIENAADLGAARAMLRTREEMSAKHIAVLERWRGDEAQLPGVPCPQCSTGQMIHWPAWD